MTIGLSVARRCAVARSAEARAQDRMTAPAGRPDDSRGASARPSGPQSMSAAGALRPARVSKPLHQPQRRIMPGTLVNVPPEGLMLRTRLRRVRRRLGLPEPAGSDPEAHGPRERHEPSPGLRDASRRATLSRGMADGSTGLRHLRRPEIGHDVVVPPDRAASRRRAAAEAATGAPFLRPALGDVAGRGPHRLVPPLLPASRGPPHRREDARVPLLRVGGSDGRPRRTRRPRDRPAA